MRGSETAFSVRSFLLRSAAEIIRSIEDDSRGGLLIARISKIRHLYSTVRGLMSEEGKRKADALMESLGRDPERARRLLQTIYEDKAILNIMLEAGHGRR